VLEIRDVDTADAAQLRGWFDVWRASQRHRPDDLLPTWEASHKPLSTPRPDFDLSLFGVHDDGELVGAGLLNLPMDDNLTVSYADVMAHPDHRRRGVGSAVLAEIERRSRAAGRERVLTEVFVPAGASDDLPGDEAFAVVRGYEVANRESSKAVDVVASEPLWPALEEQAAAALGAYRVVTWRDHCPEEYVESFGVALSRVMSLIPQGELALEDREWTVAQVRAAEERRREIGLATLESAAIAPDGTVVGLTGLRVHVVDPRVAHVSVTMVLPEHRGHRLGLATKLDNHRALRAAFRDCRLVVTSNADVNTHMNAINDAMGYRVLEQLLECQKHL
jgi:GNAT superfamily N-acetyltransferase